MFENLIAQPAKQLLVDDLAANRLPPSILFSGQNSSGKLTAALELARILSCAEGRALWTCDCGACLKHKELRHPDLLVMGPRNCALEIRASGAAFLRSRSAGTRFLFIRSVRKLALRFSPSLEDPGDPLLQKAAPLLAEIDELLEELDPSRPLTDDNEALEKQVKELVSAAGKLEDDFLPDSIPVRQVRNAAAWARLSPAGKKKVLVVENADCMQESARNAFLKVLEEPPPDAVFILTTARRGAIMPTILSRVRTYAFVDRSPDAHEEVISRVFHDAPVPGELLPAYFNRFLPVSPEALNSAARTFLETVLVEAIDEGRRPLAGLRLALDGQGPLRAESRTASVTAIVASLNKCKPGIVYQLFLARIARFMREALRSGSADARETTVYARWTELVRESLDAVDIYNISPASALERLLGSMKESL